jgi:hypothetical protein
MRDGILHNNNLGILSRPAEPFTGLSTVTGARPAPLCAGAGPERRFRFNTQQGEINLVYAWKVLSLK